MSENDLRLQVYMAQYGIGSRRFCGSLIEQGRVMGHNRAIKEKGVQVGPDDVAQVAGRA